MTAKGLNKALALFFFMALALSYPAIGWGETSTSVKLIPTLDGYPAGQSEPLFLMVRLPQDFGIQPGKDPVLKVALEQQEGVKTDQIALLVPRGMPGVVVIILKMSVAENAPPGLKDIKGSIALGASAGPQRQTEFGFKLPVLAKGVQAKETNPGMVDALLASTGLNRAQLKAQGAALAQADQGESKGFWGLLGGAVSSAFSGADKLDLAGLPLWLVLLLALGTGIVLNATPCVYPLIPITVSFFGGRAQGNRSKLLAHVLAYWAGMAVMYTVLGALAALSGRMLGEALTNPAVLIGLALVFLALAASMFGFWEIRMPGSLTKAAAANRAGIAGSLLMGLLVGILAAPCVGPVVVAFIALVAKMGDLSYGLSVFFALAVGLGLPLSALAFFSGSISRLPGAGEWMIWVRAFFGVILVVMAWFVVRPLVPPDGFFWVMAFICLAGGVYLGFFKRVGSTTFQTFSRVIGVAFILAPVLFWWLGIFTPPPVADKITWVQFSQVEVDKAAGKPKVVLFTADWCPPCRQLKAQTFPDPRVQKAISHFVTLKADMTTGGDTEAKAAVKNYLIRGVPTMVFLDQNGKLLPQFNVIGYMPPGAFVDRLNAVLKQIGASQSTAKPSVGG